MAHIVYHSAAHGLPLGAETNLTNFKVQLLDSALMQALLGQTSEAWLLDPKVAFINKGQVAEAFVGQELLAYGAPRINNQLYYWQRDKRGSQAEVDHVIGLDQQVVPIEVKAGKGSTLKSMHLFLEEHPNSVYGIRFSTQNAHVYGNVISLPLYCVMNLFKDD